MNLWPVEHFFEHTCHHFWVGLLLLVESDDKYAHLSKVTSYTQNMVSLNSDATRHPVITSSYDPVYLRTK